jgi:uncharacterized protein
MNAALAIFVKTPGLSPIKTRLAQTLGDIAAIQFHSRSCAAVESVAHAALRAGLPLDAYWVVAEQAALQRAEWSGLPQLWQGEGDLGARLHTVHAQLQSQHGSVLLIGADAPQLSVALLGDALAALGSPATPFVIGPAADGGFWLFGARVPIPEHVWLSVAYSQPDTAARLCAALSTLGAIAYLPTLADVDTAADLVALRAALAALPEALPEQRELAVWLNEIA